ncbi:hypothetical protein FRB93_001556 [Tulasnella sp. JGI-2019a]|nr:hypothetical protein FRB93_001556 [Tulasnella sp. JGI-2019a]
MAFDMDFFEAAAPSACDLFEFSNAPEEKVEPMLSDFEEYINSLTRFGESDDGYEANFDQDCVDEASVELLLRGSIENDEANADSSTTSSRSLSSPPRFSSPIIRRHPEKKRGLQPVDLEDIDVSVDDLQLSAFHSFVPESVKHYPVTKSSSLKERRGLKNLINTLELDIDVDVQTELAKAFGMDEADEAKDGSLYALFRRGPTPGATPQSASFPEMRPLCWLPSVDVDEAAGMTEMVQALALSALNQRSGDSGYEPSSDEGDGKDDDDDDDDDDIEEGFRSFSAEAEEFLDALDLESPVLWPGFLRSADPEVVPFMPLLPKSQSFVIYCSSDEGSGCDTDEEFYSIQEMDSEDSEGEDGDEKLGYAELSPARGKTGPPSWAIEARGGGV